MAQGSLFVLGVIVDQDRYLVVQERDGSWYLPAGRVEEAEDLVAALVRETIEEAGQVVAVQGLLGFDHRCPPVPVGSFRLRFVFVGHRVVVAPPKDRPDKHSMGAAWLTRDEIARLRLRDPEVLEWIRKWEEGRPLLPIAAYEWTTPR